MYVRRGDGNVASETQKEERSGRHLSDIIEIHGDDNSVEAEKEAQDEEIEDAYVLRRVMQDKYLMQSLIRVYRIQDFAESIEQVAQAIWHSLDQDSSRNNYESYGNGEGNEDGVIQILLRIRAYPTGLDKKFAEAIMKLNDSDGSRRTDNDKDEPHENGAKKSSSYKGRPSIRIKLSPSNFTHLVDVVETRARFHYGIHRFKVGGISNAYTDKITFIRIDVPDSLMFASFFVHYFYYRN